MGSREAILVATILVGEENPGAFQTVGRVELKVNENVFIVILNIISEEIDHLFICVNVVGKQGT